MKKLLLILSLPFLAVTLFAQAVDHREKLGDKKGTKMNNLAAAAVFLGGNSSTLAGDNSENNRSIMGFHAGISTPVLSIAETLGIRAELVYSQQGDQYSYGESSYYTSKTECRMNYLNLPLLARFQHRSGFFAEAGLQPGLLLSAKEKTTSTGMGGGGTTKNDIKKELNSFDLGVPIGAGYTYKKKVALSARVTPGLLNVNKKDGAFKGLKQRNMVISARLAYLL
ncbi:MAG TPA: porin family protein [Ferruginibacter sp.]|nr:porin family protein [Ferruginibacter sp.]